jgi:hypothetical protein
VIDNISDERLQEVADGLQAALAEEFGCTFVVKEDELLHQSIAEAFTAAATVVGNVRELASYLSIDVPALGLPTGDQYLADFGTTIGSRVALPRSWYTPAKARTRILVAPHEAGHWGQDQAGVDAGWWPASTTHTALYLSSIAATDAAEYVGKVEGDQYATTEAVREWLGGKGGRRPIAEIQASLQRHYALMASGVDAAGAVLRSHYRTMDRGGPPNVRSARVAIDWLESNAADCKGVVLA